MGNCQAIDNATLIIQHPSGRADKLYWPVTASEVMKSNPGHFVALFLTTTTFRSPAASAPETAASAARASTTAAKASVHLNSNNTVRITRIKLLRPTDTLILGQVYRLVTNQEVMKGLNAKKYAKMKKSQDEPNNNQERMKQKVDSDLDSGSNNSKMEKNKQAQKQEKQRSRATKANTAASKSRSWQPSLNSISESTS